MGHHGKKRGGAHGAKKTETVQLSVCMGGKCKDHKAGKLCKKLKEAVGESGLGSQLTIKKSDCLGRCKEAPVVSWGKCGDHLSHLKPKEAKDFVKKLLS